MVLPVIAHLYVDFIQSQQCVFIGAADNQGMAWGSILSGKPGFMQIVDDETITWPDYNGNGMFNTLGNIVENPACGLLFLDFEKGGILQMSGSAEIITDSVHEDLFPGAERMVEFRIKNIIETRNATNLHWSFIEYSPYNPWFC